MRAAFRIGALFAAVLLAPAESMASGWFLTADVAMGQANQEFRNSLGSFSDERLDVLRFAAGAGYLFANDVSGALEVGRSERGGKMGRTTVFHPDGDGTFFEMNRSYLDVAGTWSFRLRSGHLMAGAGVSPRVSFLLAEPEIGFSPLKSRVIPGVDPLVFLGYRGFHVFGRYVLDLGPAYKFTGENGTAEVRDSSFFVGVGFELPI